MSEYTWRKNDITLHYKNISLFIFLRVIASVVCKRQTDERRQSQITILTHNFFSSWPYHSYLQDLALYIYFLAGVRHSPWLQAGTGSRLTPTPTESDPYAGICIYHFITPTISDQPRDCFRLITQCSGKSPIDGTFKSQYAIIKAHKTAAVRPPASYLTNQSSKTNITW